MLYTSKLPAGGIEQLVMILQDYTTYCISAMLGVKVTMNGMWRREVWYMSTFKTTMRHTPKDSNVNKETWEPEKQSKVDECKLCFVK
jgi:hypothetical protein